MYPENNIITMIIDIHVSLQEKAWTPTVTFLFNVSVLLPAVM